MGRIAMGKSDRDRDYDDEATREQGNTGEDTKDDTKNNK
jgi:hypothetical protein